MEKPHALSQPTTAIKKANPAFEEKGIEPMGERVTPHSLRRTFALLRFACGDDPVFVAEQGGWKDPTFPIKVYALTVKRRGKLAGSHAEAFDAAIDWAQLGTEQENVPSEGQAAEPRATEETAP